MIYWITLPLAGIALIVILMTLFRHWKEIRLLKPESIQEERERLTRDQVIQQRFERVKADKLGPIVMLLKRAILYGKTAYHAVYLKLVRLEKYYNQAKTPFAFITPSAKDRIKTLLDDARSLQRDLKWAEAERRYLDVLALDSHNWDAYRGLGGIYLKQKLWPQAKETFEFLLKMKKADDACFAALAEIAEAEGDLVRAEDMRRKAVEFRPRSAHRQSELAAFFLQQAQAGKAWPFAKRAVELDPKSSRYLELSLEAAIILGNRLEAQRRYDKLRLLSEDRPKLQALKEKIEGMS